MIRASIRAKVPVQEAKKSVDDAAAAPLPKKSPNKVASKSMLQLTKQFWSIILMADS